MPRPKNFCPYWLSALLLTFSSPALAQAELAENVREFRLENGLRVIMVERGVAPVIDFNLTFDTGGVDEPFGLGGVAHMVEHMAFKGTRSIGSYDVAAEEAALVRLERTANALVVAREAGAAGEALASFEEDFTAAQAAAQELASPNALDTLFTNNGAQGLNAGTGYDYTSYTVSLPSNRLELYARVYADVLTNPVFRSFYEERDVVREERRTRSEDSPGGVLIEAFLAAAFQQHPYGRPLIGSADEIAAYTATAAQGVFDTFYHPNRAVLVLVGDLNPERDIRVIRRYFGFVPRGPEVRAELPAEPAQRAERRVRVPFDAEPQVIVGYHKPTYPERDAYVLDVLDYVLGAGRASRLYRALVTEQQLAVSIGTSSASPGTRYPNLFEIDLVPRAPATPRELEQALYAELSRVIQDGVTDAELARAKTLVRADVLRSFESGSGLASFLAYNETFAGGWESVFRDLERYDTVTAAEIRDVARRTFRAENRTVATLVTETAENAPAQTPAQQAGSEENQ